MADEIRSSDELLEQAIAELKNDVPIFGELPKKWRDGALGRLKNAEREQDLSARTEICRESLYRKIAPLTAAAAIIIAALSITIALFHDNDASRNMTIGGNAAGNSRLAGQNSKSGSGIPDISAVQSQPAIAVRTLPSPTDSGQHSLLFRLARQVRDLAAANTENKRPGRAISKRILSAISGAAILWSSTSAQLARLEVKQPPPRQAPTAVFQDENGQTRELGISDVYLDVRVCAMMSQTTMTMTISNPHGRALAADFSFPLPEGVSISGYGLDVQGKMVEGVAVRKEKARQVFETEMRKGVDPGIVEYVAGNFFRTRVFPVPARGSRTVMVRYVEPLRAGKDGPTYRLPLEFKDRLNQFSVAIEAVGAKERPLVDCESGKFMAGAETKHNSYGWTINMTAREQNAVGELIAAFPGLDGPQALVEKASDGEFYFCVMDKPKAAQTEAQKKIFKRIIIFWDASSSRGRGGHKKTVEFLKSFFAAAGGNEIAVAVVPFRDTVDSAAQFVVRGGDASALIAHLQDIRCDGGTQLGLLSPMAGCKAGMPSPDCYFLFTDGMNTIGSDEPADFDKPVYVFSGESVSNFPFLTRLAEKSGGRFFNLASNGKDIAGLLTNPRPEPAFRELTGETAKLADVLPDRSARLEDGTFIMVGKLRADKASIGLKYSMAEPANRKYSLAKKSAVAGEMLRRLWTQTKLAELMVQQEHNEGDITALGLRHGLVTPFTSLIVLESLEQYLQHRIAPPPSLKEMRDEYERRMDTVAMQEKQQKQNKLDRVLAMWDQRVKWWETKFDYPKNSPIVKMPTTENAGPDQTQAKLARAGELVSEGKKALADGDALRAFGMADTALLLNPDLKDARKLREDAQLAYGGTGTGTQILNEMEKRLRVQRAITEADYKRELDVANVEMAKGQVDGGKKENFEAAERAAQQARQIIRNNQHLFSASDYSGRITAIETLSDHIANQKDSFNRIRAQKVIDQINVEGRERLAAAKQARERTLDTLRQRAMALRAEGKFKEAVYILQEILHLDPQNDFANKTIEMLNSHIVLQDERSADKNQDIEQHKQFVDLRWSEVPWYALVTFPKNWKELSARRDALAMPAQQESAKDHKVKAYDIRDLIMSTPAFLGPTIDISIISGAIQGRLEQTLRSEKAIREWDPRKLYIHILNLFKSAGADEKTLYDIYLSQKVQFGNSSAFYLECGDFFLNNGSQLLGLRILSNIAELELENAALLRTLAYRLLQAGQMDLAVGLFEKVLTMRPEEPQSCRDLALALARRAELTAKATRQSAAQAEAAKEFAGSIAADYSRAMDLLGQVVMGDWQRFEQIEVIALMEINDVWAKCQRDCGNAVRPAPPLDERLMRLLDLDIRIVLTWDADMTDIDIHVREPSGEEAFYSRNRTTIGGLVSRDFTQGYGPEEYCIRKAMPGTYTIEIDYFGSSAVTLQGAVTVQAEVITNFGRPDEKRKGITLRLEEKKERIRVGQVEF
ncbi:MAG: DUF2135 domain-containing protein [Planctomycetes bacterium]|nr:DUF2135 domain-containing protein [Planctomycetota bacterium]